MLTAAVIGCGRMGAEPAARLEGHVPAGWLPMSHAECLKRVAEIKLVALSDLDPSRLARHGQHYSVDALYTDCHRMLDEIRPDIVSIATRTPGKADIVKHACARGAKGIYVEKPLANSLAECKQALGAAAEAGTIVLYGVNRRYHAVYRYAREMLLAREIGDILEITVEFGRSQLLWNHPHSVDLMLFLLNSTEVKEVQAHLSEETVIQRSERLIDSDPIVEHAHFKFISGVRGHIMRSGGCNVRIGGSLGTLTIHADGAYIQISRPRSGVKDYFLDQTFLHAPPASSATVTALNEMLQAVQAGGVGPIAQKEIEAGLRMLIGCVWSYMQGERPVELQDVPDNLVITGKYRDLYA